MTIKVDLLPTEKKSLGIDPAMIVMFMLIVGAAVACMLYSKSLTSTIDDKKAEIEAVNAEINQIKTQLPLIEETKKRIASLKREIKMIQSLVHDPLRYANLLQEVAILLPENVWIESLKIDPRGNKVDMKGHAAEVDNRLPLATVAELMRNFDESAYFQTSTLASTAETTVPPNDDRAFDFKLAITYDPEKAAKEPPTGMGQGDGDADEAATTTPPATPDDTEEEEPSDESTDGDAEETTDDAETTDAETPAAGASATPAATETPAE